MSVIFPYDVPRAIRRVHDIKVRLGGMNAVLYRYVGDDEDLQLPDTEAIYDDADLADLDQAGNAKYSDPIRTHLIVDWPEEIVKTNQDLLELSERGDETITIPVTIKFADFVTRRSYYKIGTKVVSFDQAPANIEKGGAEKDVITRLQVTEIEMNMYDNQWGVQGQATLMTDDNKLADSDTSRSSDDADTYLFSER